MQRPSLDLVEFPYELVHLLGGKDSLDALMG